MAEYINREALMATVDEWQFSIEDFGCFVQELEQIHAVDVVEVVRCKECKHCQKDMLFGNAYCDGRQVKPDDFCSYGERKPNEKEA